MTKGLQECHLCPSHLTLLPALGLPFPLPLQLPHPIAPSEISTFLLRLCWALERGMGWMAEDLLLSPQFSLDSSSSGKSSTSLMRVTRLSSSCAPMLAGVMELDLPLDAKWEFPRDKYGSAQGRDRGCFPQLPQGQQHAGGGWGGLWPP